MEFIVYCQAFTLLLLVLQLFDRSSGAMRRQALDSMHYTPAAATPVVAAATASPARPGVAVDEARDEAYDQAA